MKLNIKNDIIYYTFDELPIPHLFTTKHGGVSTGVCASMNLSVSSNGKDTKENVTENFRRLSTLGFDYDSFTLLNQRHTNIVLAVSNEHRGNNVRLPNFLEIADGMITNDPSVTLVTSHADCQALYFYDPVNQAIGLSHSGWRGVLENIAFNTVTSMQNTYHTNPSDLIVGVSPSLSVCCFEVDEDVASAFLQKFAFSKDYITQKGPKFHIDLLALTKKHLLNAGVLEKNIFIADICTRCNSELFHSHRKSGTNRGNMVAMLRL